MFEGIQAFLSKPGTMLPQIAPFSQQFNHPFLGTDKEVDTAFVNTSFSPRPYSGDTYAGPTASKSAR